MSIQITISESAYCRVSEIEDFVGKFLVGEFVDFDTYEVFKCGETKFSIDYCLEKKELFCINEVGMKIVVNNNNKLDYCVCDVERELNSSVAETK
tara:strand:+ start:1146 stop:1430 length:285 start_codon:yes stop_codon:yes gene_type:complete